MSKILVIGASGSGTSTIGRQLSIELDHLHIETDDLFWIPTDPPYTKFNTPEKIEQLVNEELLARSSWVLSGSPCGWADQIIPILDIVVFLVVPSNIRIERIRKREAERFGDRILSGGDLYHSHQNFLDWTAKYDTGNITGRTRQQHENWLRSIICPIIRFEGNLETSEILHELLRICNPPNAAELNSVSL